MSEAVVGGLVTRVTEAHEQLAETLEATLSASSDKAPTDNITDALWAMARNIDRLAQAVEVIGYRLRKDDQ